MRRRSRALFLSKMAGVEEFADIQPKKTARWSKADTLRFLDAWKESDDPQDIVDTLVKYGILRSLEQIKTKKKEHEI